MERSVFILAKLLFGLKSPDGSHHAEWYNSRFKFEKDGYTKFIISSWDTY